MVPMMRNAEQPDGLHNLSPEDKQRFAYIEGREDLFETKLLTIESDNPGVESKNILIATRDPGSANALIPIIELLQKNGGANFAILTDGRAQSQIQEKFSTKDVTPADSVLEISNLIGIPDLIITDASSEPGLETYCESTYYDVPMVLIEDYYTSSAHFLRAIQERNKGDQKNLRVPDAICVMDEEAKKLITQDFPELEERIVVTGQPAFDKIANENTEEMKHETRKKLNIPDNTKLMSFMSQMERPEMIEALAQSIQSMSNPPAVIFRRHPRDNRSYEEYEEIFSRHGVQLLHSDTMTTSEVNAASDLVITGWSTEGLNAIYRGKPTIHITDKKLQEIPEYLSLPLPPVKLGASIGVDSMDNLSEQMNALNDPDSTLASDLQRLAEKYYPKDGKNTERVIKAIREKTDVVL